MSDSNQNFLRSCNSRQPSFVKFCNKTMHDVSIEWIDFKGRHQTYAANCRPGEELSVRTFVGHPWMVYENKYRYSLTFTSERLTIFFPKPSAVISGRFVQTSVDILTPMCSLEKLSLQVLHKHLDNQSSVDEMLVPLIFKKRLKSLFFAQQNSQLPVKMIALE